MKGERSVKRGVADCPPTTPERVSPKAKLRNCRQMKPEKDARTRALGGRHEESKADCATKPQINVVGSQREGRGKISKYPEMLL